jgi:hypothetical protein
MLREWRDIHSAESGDKVTLIMDPEKPLNAAGTAVAIGEPLFPKRTKQDQINLPAAGVPFN